MYDILLSALLYTVQCKLLYAVFYIKHCTLLYSTVHLNSVVMTVLECLGKGREGLAWLAPQHPTVHPFFFTTLLLCLHISSPLSYCISRLLNLFPIVPLSNCTSILLHQSPTVLPSTCTSSLVYLLLLYIPP